MNVYKILDRTKDTRKEQAKQLLEAIQGLTSAIPDIKEALSDRWIMEDREEQAFKQGLHEAADLIEGYFMAGQARRYCTDDSALCRLLTNAIREKADES